MDSNINDLNSNAKTLFDRNILIHRRIYIIDTTNHHNFEVKHIQDIVFVMAPVFDL